MNLSLIWLPDVMPTIGALVGGELRTDRPIDGSARPAALTGAQILPSADATALGFRFEKNSYQLATVRQGKWKTHLSILNLDPQHTQPTTGGQLFDLHVDAEERIDRASEKGSALLELQKLGSAFEASLPEPGKTDLPES